MAHSDCSQLVVFMAVGITQAIEQDLALFPYARNKQLPRYIIYPGTKSVETYNSASLLSKEMTNRDQAYLGGCVRKFIHFETSGKI